MVRDGFFGRFLGVNLDIAEVNAKMARPYENGVNNNEIEGRAARQNWKICQKICAKRLAKTCGWEGCILK